MPSIVRELMGDLSEDEKQIQAKVTDSDLVSTLSDRRQLYLEVGQPRTNGYGYVLRDGDEYRAGIYIWKLDQCDETSFDDFKSALTFLLSNIVWQR